MLFRLLPLKYPLVMGILNVTPDSMYDGGRYTDSQKALARARQMVEEGVDIIDIGGESTRPNAQPISIQEELDRVLPVIEAVRKELDIPLSIDTSQAQVMSEAVRKGVHLINDVRALQLPNALATVSQLQVPVCLMHMSFPFGKPYEVREVSLDIDPIFVIQKFFEERIEACLAVGIERQNIILDPGIGSGTFGKTKAQNIEILKRLNEFKRFDLPLLVGISRKTFIGEILNAKVEDRLYGSLAAAIFALQNGAHIIRTHDVKPTSDVIKIWKLLDKSQ